MQIEWDISKDPLKLLKNQLMRFKQQDGVFELCRLKLFFFSIKMLPQNTYILYSPS